MIYTINEFIFNNKKKNPARVTLQDAKKPEIFVKSF